MSWGAAAPVPGRLPPGSPVLSGTASQPTSLLRCMLRCAGTTGTPTAASACSSKRLVSRGRTSQQSTPANVAPRPTQLHGRRGKHSMTTTQRTIRYSAQQSVKRWDFLPPHHFPQIYDPVCGMDNQTYSNECFLRKAECSNMMVIQVAIPSNLKTVEGSPHRALHTGCGRTGQRSDSNGVRCCVLLCLQTSLRVRWCVESSHAKKPDDAKHSQYKESSAQASPMTMSACCGPKLVENSLLCRSTMR